MNLEVTVGAISILSVLVMLGAGRLNRANLMVNGVTCQAKLAHAAGYQHPRIGRAVRRMTRAASFCFDRGVFESEWTLLVGVTLYTSSIRANRQSRLFELKTAMRIMTIAALHGSFENLVMKRQIELVLRFGMTGNTKLGFGDSQ